MKVCVTTQLIKVKCGKFRFFVFHLHYFLLSFTSSGSQTCDSTGRLLIRQILIGVREHAREELARC